MSRIVTNVQSLIAQRVLGGQNKALNESLTRLSTGLRINSGADDPAGLIGSESLRSEKVAISAAIDNARRADNVLSIAEGALQEVNRLLLDLEDLVDRSANEAGLSDAEVQANQVQIDAILSSIDRISNTASFNGSKLLGGGFEFTTSGIAGSAVSNAQINSVKVPEGASRQVAIDVVTASKFASISAVGGGAGGALSAVTTIEVGGSYGTENFSFASGTTLASIATAINTSTQLTGVSAVTSGGNLFFTSTDYGSDALVSVEVLSGSLSLSGNNSAGVDGTITINGSAANVKGLEASVNTGSLSAKIALDATFASTSGASTSFDITGGGARFAIAPEVSLVGIETIGLQSVSTGSLGDRVSGFLTTLQSGSTNDLKSKNFASAQRVVRAAQEQVSTLRGRIGGFQKNTLNTAINSLLVTLENTAAAESAIRDTDFAEATSALTRAQILVNSATSTLQLANAQPQSVLALLQ
ncbi:MAG TPA: flagellin [Phycisphaerae bacterium]|nr:flagellin [Phycisphaerales bacterium]HNO76842.1 flagellin [Phycisphaerae bacterium]